MSGTVSPAVLLVFEALIAQAIRDFLSGTDSEGAEDISQRLSDLLANIHHGTDPSQEPLSEVDLDALSILVHVLCELLEQPDDPLDWIPHH